jgi:hypothetical protein
MCFYVTPLRNISLGQPRGQVTLIGGSKLETNSIQLPDLGSSAHFYKPPATALMKGVSLLHKQGRHETPVHLLR